MERSSSLCLHLPSFKLLNPSHRRSSTPPSLNVADAPPTAGHQRSCTSYRRSSTPLHLPHVVHRQSPSSRVLELLGFQGNTEKDTNTLQEVLSKNQYGTPKPTETHNGNTDITQAHHQENSSHENSIWEGVEQMHYIWYSTLAEVPILVDYGMIKHKDDKTISAEVPILGTCPMACSRALQLKQQTKMEMLKPSTEKNQEMQKNSFTAKIE
ncbi:protein ACCELERATED CELL DEATH 6-like [Senna tora]|uniref:Protein ACCELERATED CELL DEATH 6-like n=1 Tax=Senna tora TaxID=362788 RepID=A0A834SFD0_9FABA|nr:protein ACCELERATED CELL DEATH 6-like [Senna tora]